MTTLSALRRALAAFAGLAIAFMVVSAVVAAGDLNAVDRQVAMTFSGWWRPWLSTAALAYSELGGIDLTSLLALGLAVYLYRIRFRAEAWALLTVPLVSVVEALYKRVVYHPEPGAALRHGDGPSLSQLLGRAPDAGSFPSGHMARTVLIYGLLAFVIFRMSERRWLRLAVVPAAVLICVLMAVDRLYLGVHWESDVLGGALLGALFLSAAIIWLDRPRGIPGE